MRLKTAILLLLCISVYLTVCHLLFLPDNPLAFMVVGVVGGTPLSRLVIYLCEGI
jgi:hypothetical protein